MHLRYASRGLCFLGYLSFLGYVQVGRGEETHRNEQKRVAIEDAPRMLDKQSATSPAPQSRYGVAASEAAYPADLPREHGEGGLKTLEIDLYGGPSLANSGSAGLGFTASVLQYQATKNNFGFEWGASAGGGGYASGGSGLQGQVVGAGIVSLGYYDVESMHHGTGPHLKLDPLYFNATYIMLSQAETMLLYQPAIDFGVHGRNPETSSTWFLQGRMGWAFGYLQGSFAKLTSASNATPQYGLSAPYIEIVLSLDQKISSTEFLRLSLDLQDTFDDLGSFGSRQIMQLTLNAYLKLGKVLWTGPMFLYTNPTKTANFSTLTYNNAIPQYGLSWLIGGALPGL